MMQLLLQERIMSVFGQIKLKGTDLDENKVFILSEKVVIFENYPLSKHWLIAWTDLSKTVKLFNEMMQN